ncbi:EamA family transporter [Peribacillus saganii]|uniref:EamA family transporter n=1 Tax=Peribacillus saganii TaxID=2303992 RepID=A0A372LMA8_9BACI|nr:EamA family transporter [Peribacillus saganii]RFU68445.1 EamA family transporter [Peribacillus saganii]
MKLFLPALAILFAATLWGAIGIFVKGLAEAGFSSMEIVTVRVVASSAILLLIGMLKNRNLLKIKIKDIYLFVGTGILSIVFFNWCYFTSMNMLSISTAVILLYTAPVFVMVLSVLFLHEKFTVRKIVLLFCTLAGCFLVTGALESGLKQGNPAGYLVGLGSGLGYALYSIFGKAALDKYQTFTITAYTFFVASLFLLPITKIWIKAPLFIDTGIILNVLGLSLLSTVLAYLLYTWGLQAMDSSRAAVLATVEPLTAMIIGFAIFGEKLSPLQLTGAGFILLAVALYNRRNRFTEEKGTESILDG